MNDEEFLLWLRTIPQPFSFTEVQDSLQHDGFGSYLSPAQWERIKKSLKIVTRTQPGSFSTNYYTLKETNL